MFARALVTLGSTLAVILSATNAAPVDIEKRDVWAPKIIEPHSGIVWKSGWVHNVTWDLSEKPVNVTNPTGQLFLRANNATLKTPLASNFNLSDGHVEITIPSVTPGCDYQMVLVGDSGNFGPTFIIASEGD